MGGSSGSTAEQMAAVGLPAVLAMRFAVTDAGARLFTEKLYERLTAGDTLTKAMHDARLALWTYTEQQRQLVPQVVTLAEWFTPVLYQNQYMGALVDRDQYSSSTLNRFYPKAAFIKGTHTRLIGEGFIGRKRLLIQLRQCFQRGKHVCLHGLGGLGKTTTAEAFADSYRKRNGHDILVFRNGPEIQEAVILERLFTKWKLVTQPEEFLIQQVRALLDSPDHSPEAKLQLLIDNYLNENPTILIVDNFEDVQTEGDDTQQQAIVSDSLRTFMRHLLQHAPPSCPVLLTSRYLITDLADLVTHLAVDKMTSAEQYRYINFSEVLRKIPLAERAIIDRRFDGHPAPSSFWKAC
ncbi:AAA family ATPase [Spirosoma sp. HMF3257]|uniref:AAA+ ATPase domain-containing protein n=1 Tax=Spirosoma telluris TaxID=2183553 RepID=A0A327NPM2_9BACT|nr:AAA family ATPase [Spirosoma telluris]RAI77361.1 hypothetical protein HMF3257_30100 [Spirosoma telluris]